MRYDVHDVIMMMMMMIVECRRIVDVEVEI